MSTAEEALPLLPGSSWSCIHAIKVARIGIRIYTKGAFCERKAAEEVGDSGPLLGAVEGLWSVVFLILQCGSNDVCHEGGVRPSFRLREASFVGFLLPDPCCTFIIPLLQVLYAHMRQYFILNGCVFACLRRRHFTTVQMRIN